MRKFIFILILLLACSRDSDKDVIFTPNNNVNDWYENEQTLIRKIDSFRILHLKEGLVPDKLHRELALERNVYNAARDSISHEGFQVVYIILKEKGLSSIGENLGIGYTNVTSVLNAWINSEGHRRNLLNGWKYIGLSIYLKEDINYYCIIFSR